MGTHLVAMGLSIVVIVSTVIVSLHGINVLKVGLMSS